MPFLFILSSIRGSDASNIRIANHNILNFPGSQGYQRLDDLRVVYGHIQPDVLGVQEMTSQAGCGLILDSVLNYRQPGFASAPFNDGPDTDNALFYRTSKVEFISASYIPTDLRDIAEYRLRSVSSQNDFYVYLIHFKASQGSANESLRIYEAEILRDRLDSLGAGRDFMVMGDFNFYDDEPAFHELIDSAENNNGRFCDPLNSTGAWHDDSSCASVHTQSSRLEALPDGGASGGLDDRFDLLLCSASLLDQDGFYLAGHAYSICGQDGIHFNRSVNEGANQSVPDTVADALYYASDHLPLYADLADTAVVGAREKNVGNFRLGFNVRPSHGNSFFTDFKGRVNIFDVSGTSVKAGLYADGLIDLAFLPEGVYFLEPCGSGLPIMKVVVTK